VVVLATVAGVDVVATVVNVAVVVVTGGDEACLPVFLEPPLAAPTMTSTTKATRLHLTAFARVKRLTMRCVPVVDVVVTTGASQTFHHSRHRNGQSRLEPSTC
jgi:hypothetical protein